MQKFCPDCSEKYIDTSLTVCPKDKTLLLTPNVEPSGEFDLVGQYINDRYKVTEKINSGKLYTTYKATHMLFDSSVFIKLLKLEFSSDQDCVKQLQQEAQISAHLYHPNITTVHDFGILSNGQPYLVAVLIQGTNLKSIVDSTGPLSINRFKNSSPNWSKAMAYTHDRGAIHQNINPRHIMISEDVADHEFPVITSFRLAKMNSKSGKKITPLNVLGHIQGTPSYMSPEQIMGHATDQRSDIYSMGCTMYFALTGQAPFKGIDVIDTMQAHLERKIESGLIANQLLEDIVFKTLEAKPDDRFQSMLELRKTLAR